MPSANVGSSRCACQATTGIWLVMSVRYLSKRSSTISSKSRLNGSASGVSPKSSSTHKSALASAPSLAAIAVKRRDRDDAIAAAYASGAYGYRELAEHFGLHLGTVGRIIRARRLQCEN